MAADYQQLNDSEAMAIRYLETAVRTASPAKLRLMLIERAAGLCQIIESRWRESVPELGYDEQTLHLRDILTELLAGVGKSDLPVALQVSDLYVFLTQHLTTAELMRDVTMIEEIRLVLETEAETWRIVCETTARQTPPAPMSLGRTPDSKPMSLNLEG